MFEFFRCAWSISSKYAGKKLKDLHSIYRNRECLNKSLQLCCITKRLNGQLNENLILIIFILFPSPATFSALFSCSKFMSVSFTETFAFSWEIVSWEIVEIWVFSRFIHYSKRKLHLVEITQIRLQKMKNVVMVSFYYLVL